MGEAAQMRDPTQFKSNGIGEKQKQNNQNRWIVYALRLTLQRRRGFPVGCWGVAPAASASSAPCNTASRDSRSTST